MTDPLERLQEDCDQLEDAGVDTVVARWVDEVRPVDGEDEDGVTVKEVTEVTLKAAPDGEVVAETYPDVTYAELKGELESRAFEVVYRAENIT
ncbi:MAG: hypothetical protein ABEL76_07805 [Bradymonadaceae bacterium]